MNGVHDWSEVREVLVVRLDSLGDVLMTEPALRALKECRPDRRLTLLTSPAAAPLGSLLPELNEVLVYEAPWMKATPLRKNRLADEALLETLRKRRFDAAVIFTVFSQCPLPAALTCYLADIPRRLAYCRENPYQLLTDWIRETELSAPLRHEVRRQLDLVEEVGCTTADERIRVTLPRSAQRWAGSLLRELEFPVLDRWVLIHPGASAASRRYPAGHFAAAARELVLDHALPVLFTGSHQEQELIEDIRTRMKAPSAAAPGLSLAQLAALIDRASVLLTNNTGPAHLAAAVGTPVVDLYALTNPQHTPWGVPHRVLFHDVPCKFCYKSVCPQGHQDCLAKVDPAEVVRATCELLREHPKAGTSLSLNNLDFEA